MQKCCCFRCSNYSFRYTQESYIPYKQPGQWLHLPWTIPPWVFEIDPGGDAHAGVTGSRVYDLGWLLRSTLHNIHCLTLNWLLHGITPKHSSTMLVSVYTSCIHYMNYIPVFFP